MPKKKREDSVRVTIHRELFDIIYEQAESMNEVCHGVLNMKFSKNNDIFKKASQLVAQKYKRLI